MCASGPLRDWETARRNSPTDLKHTQPPSRKQDRPDETRKTMMHLSLQAHDFALSHATHLCVPLVSASRRLSSCGVMSFVVSFTHSSRCDTQHARHLHTKCHMNHHTSALHNRLLQTSGAPAHVSPTPPPLRSVVLAPFRHVCLRLRARCLLLCLVYVTSRGSERLRRFLWYLVTHSVLRSWTSRGSLRRTRVDVGRVGVRVWCASVTTSTARGASSDATSCGTISSTHTQRLLQLDPAWKTTATEDGDRRTDQAISGATGGDPKTDHEAFGETGGDPNASFGNVSMSMAATCPPYRLGWLASTTANPVPASPGLLTVSSVDQEVPDGFPRENSEHLDGFPSSSSLTHEHFGGSSLIDRCLIRRFMNLSSDCASVRFSRTFLHDVDESEDLRQSRIEQLQNLPASVIPSELSAHQMAVRSEDPLVNHDIFWSRSHIQKLLQSPPSQNCPVIGDGGFSCSCERHSYPADALVPRGPLHDFD